MRTTWWNIARTSREKEQARARVAKKREERQIKEEQFAALTDTQKIYAITTEILARPTATLDDAECRNELAHARAALVQIMSITANLLVPEE